MAKGDIFSDLQSIIAGAYLNIRPTGTIEAAIHNIYHEDDVTLEFTDGANNLDFESVATGKGAYTYYAFHVKNSLWVRVRNDAGAPKLIGYDGIITRI